MYGQDPYLVVDSKQCFPASYSEPGPDGWYELLGIAESENDVWRILFEADYDGEYIHFFMKDLAYKYGRVW
jgi:hypothetical protein